MVLAPCLFGTLQTRAIDGFQPHLQVAVFDFVDWLRFPLPFLSEVKTEGTFS